MTRPEGRVLVVANGSVWGMGWLASWLADGGLSVDVVRPFEGERLPARTAHDALVVLPGSTPASARASTPWLARELELVSRALDDATPTLGLCLGAQVLAVADGGTVGPCTDGGEYGIVRVEPTAAAAHDPLFRSLSTPAAAVAWHRESVLRLPPGGLRLASTARCLHAAFRVRDRSWGIQFHPEATMAGVRRWAVATGAELLGQGVRPHEAIAAVHGAQADLLGTWSAVIAGFVDAVRGDVPGSARALRDRAVVS